MKGKPGDIVVAMQMGAEIGLSPMQALQNIAVINGRPCVWGDAALAVVISSPNYISHREWFEGSVEKGNLTAFCEVRRRNSEPYVKSFSMDEAKKAGLWSKAGVWQQYPSRMLQMRARAFAIRDQFADALRGISVREEVEDYQVLPAPAPRPQTVNAVLAAPMPAKPSEQEVSDELDMEFTGFMQEIELCETEEELKKAFMIFKKLDWSSRPELLSKLLAAKDEKKNVFTTQKFVEELGTPEDQAN